MIALALALLAPQDRTPEGLSAGQLISKMLAKYHGAQRIKGTVVTTVQYGGSTLRINTTLQIERPSKLYMLQVSPQAPDTRYLVTSDGVLFSYDKPISRVDEELDAKGRLIESVDGPLGKLTVGDIYRAATESIAERSLPLDVAFAHGEDLKLLRAQLATRQLSGSLGRDGQTLWKVTGTYRLNEVSDPIGSYEIHIAADGTLRAFGITGKDDLGSPVQRTWDIDLALDGEIDQALFKVVR